MRHLCRADLRAPVHRLPRGQLSGCGVPLASGPTSLGCVWCAARVTVPVDPCYVPPMCRMSSRGVVVGPQSRPLASRMRSNRALNPRPISYRRLLSLRRCRASRSGWWGGHSNQRGDRGGNGHRGDGLARRCRQRCRDRAGDGRWGQSGSPARRSPLRHRRGSTARPAPDERSGADRGQQREQHNQEGRPPRHGPS